MEEAVLKDRTVRELSEMIPDISKITIDKMLTDNLDYAKLCARWVPRVLTESHKWQCVEEVREFF